MLHVFTYVLRGNKTVTNKKKVFLRICVPSWRQIVPAREFSVSSVSLASSMFI